MQTLYCENSEHRILYRILLHFIVLYIILYSNIGRSYAKPNFLHGNCSLILSNSIGINKINKG